MFNHDEPLGLPKGSLTGIGYLATLAVVLITSALGREIDLEYLGAALALVSLYGGFRQLQPPRDASGDQDPGRPGQFDEIDQWARKP